MVKKYIASALCSLGMAQMTFQPNQIAANDQIDEFPCCEAGIVAGQPLDPCFINSGYPYPASPAPCCGWDIYAKGDFIYWSLNDIAYSAVAQKISFDGLQVGNFQQIAPYRPGFRVSLGVDLDSVVLDATYTSCHHHSTSRFSAGNNELIRLVWVAPSILTGPPLAFSNVRSTRQTDIDIGLISVQKPVYMGKKILMNLNYGLMTFWTAQKWNINCSALAVAPPNGTITSNGIVRTNHKAWTVGPNLGFKATALFPMGFQAIASIDLAIQYASLYKTDSTTSFPQALDPLSGLPITTDNTTIKTKGNIPHLQASHGGEIGLGWGGYLWCDKYHLDLTATYSVYYQHIFVVGSVLSNLGSDLTLGSFSIHGIAIGGRLDF